MHEVHKPDGEDWEFEEFIDFMSLPGDAERSLPERLLEHVRQLNGSDVLDDDFSMLEIRFNGGAA